MKGDFSRSTFRRPSHYDGVRLQQGRVLLDAEANELVDIQNHLRTATARDVIGPAGAPRHDDAFRVDWAEGNLAFTSGRFYVDGMLCESEGESIRVTPQGALSLGNLILDRWTTLVGLNRWVEVIGRNASGHRLSVLRKITGVDENARRISVGALAAPWAQADAIRTTGTYLTQPDYPEPEQTEVVAGGTRVKAGVYLVWLDVWQRHITHLEDPLIREKALGGPDTTTRTKTVWQVRLEPNVTDCKSFKPKVSTGRLAAQDRKPAGPPKECEISPQAGYRRLENQLYRVEIHKPGNKGAATFKWSRDNGSTVFAIEAAVAGHPKQLKLRTIGRDDVLRLQTNDFVELIDDVRELDRKPGKIFKVLVPPAESDRIVTLDARTTGEYAIAKNPRLRLWQSGETALGNGFVPLEDGVEVRFETGDYLTGDYWLIPARTSISEETGHVEWPLDGGGNPLALPAEGIVHHYAPLATIDAAGKVTHDCRPLFAPLTAPDLFYLAGDGQEIALADPKLPQNLEVLVSNGEPVAGAKVRFEIKSGGGSLTPASGEVTTGADGKASCAWTAGNPFAAQRQTATATLVALETGDYVPALPPITFNAWAKLAKDVVYEPGACDFLNGTKTVQEALDKLCKRPSGGGICTVVLSPEMDWVKAIRDLPQDEDAEICFRAGVYELRELLQLGGRRRLTFNGIGEGSRINAPELADAIAFEGLTALVMRDLSVESGRVRDSVGSPVNLPGVVTLRKVTEATFQDVAFRCGAESKNGIACLVANTCNEVRVSRCDFDVGTEQDGFVAVATAIVQVESSRFNGPALALLRPQILRAAFPNLTFGDPTPAQNVRLTLGDQRVAFTAPAAEAQEWQFVAGNFAANSSIAGREAAMDALATFAFGIAATNVLSERLPNVRRRLAQPIRELAAARAREAIVVLDANNAVTLRDNIIERFARGILAGAAYVNEERNLMPLARVFIHDNVLSLTSALQPASTENGIDVGTNDHLTVRGNYVETSQLARDNGPAGFFVDGAFGGLAVLRDNQVRRFATGYHARGTNPPPPVTAGGRRVKWLLADNDGLEVLTPISTATNFDRDNTVGGP